MLPAYKLSRKKRNNNITTTNASALRTDLIITNAKGNKIPKISLKSYPNAKANANLN